MKRGVMPKNLPALFKTAFPFIAISLIICGTILHAQESSAWYRSNQAGMALQLVPSRLIALRNEYCLSIETARPADIPGILLSHYDDLFTAELRTLYENGQELRRQWLFRDSEGLVRLTASGSANFFAAEKPAAELSDEEIEDEETTDEENSEEDTGTGFIEIRDEDGLIVRELRYEDDRSEWDYRFFYNEQSLVSAETWFKSSVEENIEESDYVPVSTDYYRYSRSGSLRAIDRTLHERAGDNFRLGFPRLGTGVSPEEELITRGIVYTSDFLQDIYIPEGAKISYTLDSRGRIMAEVWKDADDTILGEFRNTWAGDRLGSVLWKSKDDERFVEYEYGSDGSRTVERNYRRGELERIVRSFGDRDMEEIYMNERLILRAIWEKGTKISEEWISPGAGNR